MAHVQAKEGADSIKSVKKDAKPREKSASSSAYAKKKKKEKLSEAFFLHHHDYTKRVGVRERLASLADLCRALGCDAASTRSEAWQIESHAFLFSVKFGNDYYTLVQKQLQHILERRKLAGAKSSSETEHISLFETGNLLMHTSEQLSVNTPIYFARQEKKKNVEHAFKDLKNLEETKETLASAQIRCRDCGSTDVMMQSKQKASADEPANINCQCAACGSKWNLSR